MKSIQFLKKKLFKKKITPTTVQITVQICRLENIEQKSINKFLIVVNIPSQHVELVNLIYNSLL